MKLYGYDANSQVIVTHLSPEEIAQAGIDPWRLDLMDKAPIIIGNLRFSPLSDVAFAYRTRDRQTFLGFHDGKDPVCFTGEEHGSTIGEIRLGNVRMSDRKFGDHFAEYLQHRIAHSAGFCMEITDLLGNFAVTVEANAPADDSAERQAPAGYQAKPASAILVRGGTVTFTDCDSKSLKSLEPGIFRGDMLAERTVPFKLPAEIGWIFEALGDIPAFVIGKELRQALAGEKIDSVSFMIDRDDLAAVKSRLLPHGLDLGPANMNAYKVSMMSFSECPLGEPFQHGRCTYRLHVSEYSSMSKRLIENVNLRTAESIYAVSPFELRGSRIAFADLAKKRARLLRYNHPWAAGSSFEESALSKEGFTEF